MNLNHKFLRNILDDKQNKYISCIECSDIIAQYQIILTHLDFLVKNKFSKHELAQWINATNCYITLKGVHRSYNYRPRSIVYAELGTNIGNEISYEHVAIIIREGSDKAFIVPCSSSEKSKERLKKCTEDYILGTVKAGFPKETVIYIKDARWISKARIKSAYKNKVDPKLFEKIYGSVFEDIFKAKSLKIQKQEKKIMELINEIARLNLQFEELYERLKRTEKERDKYFNDLDIATS